MASVTSGNLLSRGSLLLLKSTTQNKINVLLRSLNVSSIKQGEVRVRFAPSPTGQLHIGGFRTALYNYLFTRSSLEGGKFILRIEDTDQTRLVPGAADQLESLLEWANIPPDESPKKGGPCGPYVQSERLSFYKEAVESLLESGNAYRCFCTEKRLQLLKKESARNKTVNKYDGRCLDLSQIEIAEKMSQGIPFTVRFKLPRDDTKVSTATKTIYSNTFDDLILGETAQGDINETGDPIIIKVYGKCDHCIEFIKSRVFTTSAL